MAGAAPIETPKDLVRRMPLIAEDLVAEYLPDQQWAHMRPKIQEQMTKAFDASSDVFVGADYLVFLNYLFFMSPAMIEYLAKIIEGPRDKKNPFRLIELQETARNSVSTYVDLDIDEQVNHWTEQVLAWIMMAYVFRRVRGMYYASLTEPPLREVPEEFLYIDVSDFMFPKLVSWNELRRVDEKANQKVKAELAWAKRKVEADRAKVAGQIGEAGVAANQAWMKAKKEGKKGGRRTRRSKRGKRSTRRRR